MEQKFGVEVAEGHPHHCLWALMFAQTSGMQGLGWCSFLQEMLV